MAADRSAMVRNKAQSASSLGLSSFETGDHWPLARGVLGLDCAISPEPPDPRRGQGWPPNAERIITPTGVRPAQS